ncbi:MAG: hypothetical protein AAB478_04810 [Patescibacteria group bacterium]
MAEVKYTCTPCGTDFNDLESLNQHQSTQHATKTEVTVEGERK